MVWQILEAVGVEGKVFGDVYIRKLGPENEVLPLLCFNGHSSIKPTSKKQDRKFMFG